MSQVWTLFCVSMSKIDTQEILLDTTYWGMFLFDATYCVGTPDALLLLSWWCAKAPDGACVLNGNTHIAVTPRPLRVRGHGYKPDVGNMATEN